MGLEPASVGPSVCSHIQTVIPARLAVGLQPNFILSIKGGGRLHSVLGQVGLELRTP